MYNEFVKNITKESDPVRQKHYTTKKHWLVDFINIFWFILILFLFRQQIPYSADIIHTDLRICTFHPVSVSTFFIRNNGEITECILLCMFLCKGWLFQIYEYHCPDCFEADTEFLADTAGISVCGWYNGIQIWQQRTHHHSLWQLVYETEPGVHRWRISKPGSGR